MSFSLATPSLAQSPIARDQGRRSEVNQYGARSLPMMSGTNASNASFSGIEGFAGPSRWVETEQGRRYEIDVAHRHVNGPVVNIERAGNVLMGPNYGYAINIEEFNVLRNLPLHPDISGHLSEYFPNSRTDDEARILGWVDSNHSRDLVLCVLGKVGVGKSTLARHLAARLRQHYRLAAEVFLGFALPDWTPELVIRMIAGQLCGTYPMLKRAIAEAMDLDIGPSVSLETRIRRLILEPIRSLTLPQPLVVVLDALDQWAPHPIFIKALTCLTTETHLIRFIVLGRPGLEDGFQNIFFRIYNLPNVSKDILRTYFSERFAKMQWEYGRKPSSKTIDQLIDKADGFFIWISTLCSVLEDKLSSPKPHDTLTSILQSQRSIGNNDTLANLYHGTINLCFPKPNHQAMLKVYLGAVLVLQEPLPVAAFAGLVSMDTVTVRRVQAELGVLQAGRPQDTQDLVLPATFTFHLSFLEYLQSSETPSHLAFPIDTFASHAQLGKTCLEELHRTPPSSQFSFTSSLRKYVMVYWPIHTAHGTPSVSPTSDVEWRATPHYSILNRLSGAQWQHWAATYLRLVNCSTAQDVIIEEFMQVPALDPMITQLSHTRWHLISRITQLLLEGTDTEGTPGTIAVAEVAVRLQHQSSHAWLELGIAYRNSAKTNESWSWRENAVHACRCAAEVVGGYEGRQVHGMLAICLAERFQCLGSKGDLDEAISLERALLWLAPPSHPNRLSSLGNLANSLWLQFWVTGCTVSLEESIVLSREALLLRPPGHPDRSSSLNNLAAFLRSQFEVTGRIASLEESIVLSREALSLWPPGHPDRPLSLTNLASFLRSQFEVTGCIASLEESIMLNQEALSLRPPGLPGRPLSLNNLANSLRSQFEVTGCIASLEESIVLNREALSLRPPGHPNRPSSLNNLANSLRSRFEVTGCIANLEECIVLNREALSLCPPGHPNHPSALSNLAGSVRSQFEVTGCIASLEESIVLNREALSLWPPGHPNRTSSLNNLANSLHSHFEVTRCIASLDESIVLNQEALLLRPPGHPDRPFSLRNLANSLQSQFEVTGCTASLDTAIALNRDALLLWMPGHQSRPWALNGLAKSLHSRHNVAASSENLNEAIALCREALLIWLQGHPYRAKPLSALASSLNSHFELTGIRESLDEAISLHREAVSVLPTNHPKRALSLRRLANSLQKSYELTGNVRHLNEARSLVPATHGVQ